MVSMIKFMLYCKLKIALLLLFVSFAASASSLEKQLQIIAAEMQPHLPANLADGIEAVAIIALGRNLVAQYRLDLTSREFSSDISLGRDFQLSSINSSCTDPRLRQLLKNGAILTYRFSDKSGKFLMETVVREATCINNRM